MSYYLNSGPGRSTVGNNARWYPDAVEVLHEGAMRPVVSLPGLQFVTVPEVREAVERVVRVVGEQGKDDNREAVATAHRALVAAIAGSAAPGVELPDAAAVADEVAEQAQRDAVELVVGQAREAAARHAAAWHEDATARTMSAVERMATAVAELSAAFRDAMGWASVTTGDLRMSPPPAVLSGIDGHIEALRLAVDAALVEPKLGYQS